jgi:hypothetical protein
MIIGHCSSSGHRGGETTTQVIAERFWWYSLSNDVSEFVSGCFHCLSNAPQHVPRPLGEQIHASERNEIIHYDLVLKDDLSNFYV